MVVVVVEGTERERGRPDGGGGCAQEGTARRRAANASSSFAHSTSVGFGRERKGGRAQAQQWLRASTLNAAC